MEYSPRGSNPLISIVDAGTFEIVSEHVAVQSSADLLQRFTSVLDERQITSHLEAAQIVQKTVARAWDQITESLRKEKCITEYDVQNFILSEFAAQKCVAEEGPICAVNGNASIPHYMATKQSAKQISHGDLILIDLWCKQDVQEAVYADITRVAVAAPQPTPKQQEIFEIVKEAQIKGIEFVKKRMESEEGAKGYEVDDICRGYIQKKGYGEFFTHRTGHNIDTHVHGGGANFDNLETSDKRQLLPGMCFSVEPGIYVPGQFGIRLETNLLLHPNGSVEITGGMEENILCLL
jgi:Xaa-Pro aminopeptidase